MKRNKRIRSLIIFLLLLVVLLGAGLGLRNFVLHRIKTGIRASFNYGAIHLTVIPPALVIEDVRTVSSSPFFSARKITVRISFLTLFDRDKSFRVLIEKPVLRIYDSSETAAKGKDHFGIALPFSIANGVVRDGEIHFYGKDANFSAKGVRAVFRQKKDEFTLRVESEDNSLTLNSVRASLTGKISAYLEGKGQTINVRKVTFAGEDFLVKARGTLTNIADPQFDLQTDLFVPAPLIADLLHLPFTWGGKARGEGRLVKRQGRVEFQAGITSDDFVLNAVALGTVEGKVTVGGVEGGRVELAFQKRPNPREYVDISFDGKKVTGVVRGVHLEPIVHYLGLPWPVKSPAWGDFSLENKQLRVHAEFKDDLMLPAPGRFPFRGAIDLQWDGKKSVRFASPQMETSFGTLAVEGDLDIGRDVRVTMSGDVGDVRQGREFTSLVLKEKLDFPEIRGKGRAEIKILGDYRAPQIKADFSLAPGGYDRFDAAAVGGLLEIAHKEITGLFKVQDPDMRGDVRLRSRPGVLDVQIHADDADLQKVLSPLDIRIPLKGRASGDFAITKENKALLVNGNFSSARVKLMDQDLADVRGKLTWSDAAKTLAFSDLSAGIYGGRFQGSGRVGLKSREFDLDVQASGLDLSILSPQVGGRATFDLKGKGLLDKDAATGKFSIKDIRVAPLGSVEINGDLALDYLNDKLTAKLTGRLDPGGNEFTLSFSYPQPDASYLVNLQGRFLDPDLFMPWPGVKGEVNYLAEIKGKSAAPQVNGVIDFKGPVFPFPDFAQALTDYSGLLFIQNDTVSIRSLQGKLGGGDVFGSGEIRFGKGGLEFLDVRVDGKDMMLAFLERTRALADGSLRLIKDTGRFSLSGDFLVKNLSWKRELSEKFSFASNPYPGPKKENGIFDDMSLDIRLRANDDAIIENSLGKIQGRFDLTITGNIKSPVILGDIEGLRGDVNFQDRKFRLLKARLSFFNPASVEPYLEFQGETFLKDYRVTFSLSGLVDRLKPEFASSPPLPSEDVLALLALGESFKRTYSYDTSSQLSTGSLLSFQLAEEANKRAEQLFSLDRFRIDPFVLGATTEMTARLTVGKKISRDIILLYSTNLTSQREEIVRLEWEWSESFSLVGMRDERGRISFDAKVRFRF
jgi:hypothetical protein